MKPGLLVATLTWVVLVLIACAWFFWTIVFGRLIWTGRPVDAPEHFLLRIDTAPDRLIARQDFEREGIVWSTDLNAFGVPPTVVLPTDEYRERTSYTDPPEYFGTHSFPWSGEEVMLAAVAIEEGAGGREQVTLTLYDLVGSRWQYTYEVFHQKGSEWVMPRGVEYQPDRGPALLFGVIYSVPVMLLSLVPALLAGGATRLAMKHRRKDLKHVSTPAEDA